MPIVRVEETLACGIESAWDLVADIEAYPQRMDAVKHVAVRERQGNHLVSEWVVELKDSEMKWTEQEIHHPEAYRIDFTQVEGDLARFDGYWQLESMGEHATRAVLLIDFDIGIPALDDILNPIAVEALRENSQSMLQSLQFASQPSLPLQARG